MKVSKLSEAKNTINRCIGPKGFYAGDYYKQYWVRDLGYCIDVLLELGYEELIKSHLLEILKRQKPNGEIPTNVWTKEAFSTILTLPSTWLTAFKYRGFYALKNLTQYTTNFHNWTTDSPMIFLVSIKKYEEFTKDRFFSENYSENINKILKFVENLKSENGMIKGAGWFDAMNNYNDKFTFHNQVWLYKMYKELKMNREAEKVKQSIEKFWNEKLGFYNDYLGSNHFDTLSHALALDFDLIPKNRIEKILKMFQKVCTKYGYLNLYPAYPRNACTQYPNIYQNSTIWPFIEYRIAIVFSKFGMNEELKKIKFMMENREGFNEWYSPLTGKPGGSKNQLWTACAYIGVCSMV